jgi:phage gp36-like protein
MPYCTLEDIKSHIPEQNLIQLTDDENLGIINETRVNDAIDYADQLIGGYLRGRYTLPLDPVPGLVKKLSIDFSIFWLYSRRFELEMPEGMMNRYKNALKILEMIQRGTVSLGTAEGTTPEPGEYKTNKTLNDRVFSKNVLEKM